MSLFNCTVGENKVPKWGYSITKEELDPEKTAKASGREVRVSHKHAREICKTIKGMMLTQAKQYLRDVTAKKKPVPFTRFKKKAGHRHGLEKTYAGRYPVKAAKQILKKRLRYRKAPCYACIRISGNESKAVHAKG